MERPSPELHIARVSRMFLSATINRFYEPSIALEPGAAEVRLAIRPDMHHPGGSAHGSVYFNLLDDAAFLAAQTLSPERLMRTTAFTVYLLGAMSKGEGRASGRVTHVAGRQILADAWIT